mmetsp:Transcript_56618/g.123839  ORF Transcript_56618/g.123839 Transcript_56618/m.123839 type:complete len:111 (-) Transcript_56618:356-688(-)
MFGDIYVPSTFHDREVPGKSNMNVFERGEHLRERSGIEVCQAADQQTACSTVCPPPGCGEAEVAPIFMGKQHSESKTKVCVWAIWLPSWSGLLPPLFSWLLLLLLLLLLL